MGEYSSFFLSNISFDASQNSNLHIATRFCNGVGNFFLSPVRHFFHGRSMTVFVVPINLNQSMPMFHHIDDSTPKGLERLFKTIASIIFIVPGLIIGSLLKGGAFLASSRLRSRNEMAANLVATMPQRFKPKYFQEVTTAFVKRDLNRLKDVLVQLKTAKKLDDFLDHFSQKSVVFLKEYNGLYNTSYITKKSETNVVNIAIAAFLSLYANDQISQEGFFGKLLQLNDLGLKIKQPKTWIEDNITENTTVQEAAAKIFKQLI